MFAGPRPSLSSPSAGIRHPGGVGIPTALSVGIGAVLALLFSTVVQMLFGELFPNNLAIDRPEPAARRLARSTTVYLKVFGWLIWAFDQAANLLLRALKIEPVHDVEHAATARDLEHNVEGSRGERGSASGAVYAARPHP